MHPQRSWEHFLLGITAVIISRALPSAQGRWAAVSTMSLPPTGDKAQFFMEASSGWGTQSFPLSCGEVPLPGLTQGELQLGLFPACYLQTYRTALPNPQIQQPSSLTERVCWHGKRYQAEGLWLKYQLEYTESCPPAQAQPTGVPGKQRVTCMRPQGRGEELAHADGGLPAGRWGAEARTILKDQL